jgi:dipeptidyl aminopeptidase/acylaminoacyl peptidase
MAGGRGSCLRADPATSAFFLEIFDDTFTPRHRVPLTGVPSRTRVSPDGRWAAATVFEHGHSYAEEGFSTRTTIVETATGRVHADLEQLQVERDGRPFQSPDFNFWGVTFGPDSDTYYATLSSGGVNYLVTGRVQSRQLRVVRTGVECPSLSPDGTQIAYKHRASRDTWQLRLYDLQSGTERALSHETRSVDDQVDWLDDRHLIYQVVGPGGSNVWSIETSGDAAPRLLVEHAFSPSVIR